MSFSIAGKTAIVTGAGHGIGLAIGRHFVEEGAKVMFADIDDAALAKQIGTEFDDADPMRTFAGDLRQKLTVANLLSATIDAFDRVDILVNAARSVTPGDPMDGQEADVEASIQQNMISALKLSQLVAKRMRKQAEDAADDETAGTIVNLSSTTPFATHPDLLAYSVSAAAMNQMTRSLALALAPHRIRVNAVAFSSVLSASLKEALREDDVSREAIVAATPLGRIAKSDELASAVQFLASEASSFITGAVLQVDGGRTLVDPTGVAAH